MAGPGEAVAGVAQGSSSSESSPRSTSGTIPSGKDEEVDVLGISFSATASSVEVRL